MELDAAQRDFVHSYCVTAIVTSERLACEAVRIGRQVYLGNEDALMDLRPMCDVLVDHVHFMTLAAAALGGTMRCTSGKVAVQRDRLLHAIARMQASIDEHNLQRLGLDLARGLSLALLEYREVGGHVAMGLRGSVVAAA